MHKISVIIPIYNAEQYLERTIKCLEGQTFNDFEVILFDDGSKDSSRQICEEIAQKDSRFKYYYQQNSGVSAARNNALNISQGNYITFIDADDEIPSNYLEELLNTSLENNCDIAICDVSVISKEKEVTRFTCDNNKLNKVEALNLLLSRKGINSGPCAKMFSREVLKEIEFPALKAYEDIIFVLNAIETANYIVSTARTEYKYYQNDSSAMSTFKKMPSADIITATTFIMEYLCKHKELDDTCVYVTLSHLMQYALSVIGGQNKVAQDFITNTRTVLRKYIKEIIRCNAFPWKEKITFILFAFGINYADGKFSIVR